jgi:hypothetical protein
VDLENEINQWMAAEHAAVHPISPVESCVIYTNRALVEGNGMCASIQHTPLAYAIVVFTAAEEASNFLRFGGRMFNGHRLRVSGPHVYNPFDLVPSAVGRVGPDSLVIHHCYDAP